MINERDKNFEAQQNWIPKTSVDLLLKTYQF